MNEGEFKKLESRVYAFSVDVFSFVKTLINKNLANQHSKNLLDNANKLYGDFLDVFDNQDVIDEQSLKKCIQLAEVCSNLLGNIEVEKALLNEKVDLTIEANELTRILKSNLKN